MSSPKDDNTRYIYFKIELSHIFADTYSSRWKFSRYLRNGYQNHELRGWILGNYEILPVQIRDKSGPIIVGGQGGIEQLATRLVDWLLFNEADFIFHRRAAESIVKRPECFPRSIKFRVG